MRRVCIVIVLLFALSACGSGGSHDSGSGSKAAPGAPTTSATEVPLSAVGNVKTLRQRPPGSLCKTVTAEVVKTALDPNPEAYKNRTFTVQSEEAAFSGLDGCVYTEPASEKGLAIIVTVRSGVTDEVWNVTEKSAGAQLDGAHPLTIKGATAAIRTNTQVIIRKGSIMVAALNSSLGRVPPHDLERLTAFIAQRY
ncbi:MAG: hypothetical protein JWL97_4075 [Gemmatimonadales bacterium]|jgi:hypothetical protein|nr:hypothetical protein [Gemmatimonadales bacterium]